MEYEGSSTHSNATYDIIMNVYFTNTVVCNSTTMVLTLCIYLLNQISNATKHVILNSDNRWVK
jgi:hypothetical protein